ncbi:hypothetical protein [Priestia aryabhattai]|uniref:hypothetical protein n=1 Tax=Priestia aryabhattai TaxID=412384 RepID=UPI00217542AF|nr:hypothetical protein [Priestia aryabhattai]
MGKEYRCAREEGRNPTSVKVNVNTLGATCFSTNLNGDLITLVQNKINKTFPQTIKLISEIIDYKSIGDTVKYTPPFGGFYKKIAKLRNEEEVDIEIYSDEVLERFEKVPNILFYEDGIIPSVQQEFNIGYDSVSGRISVPWYSTDGMLCGVMGRLNKRKVGEDESKWFPIIPFPKSQTLYGFSHNYSSIQEKGLALIGESEKHTLQLASHGMKVGLSLGGSFMSELQANNIKSLLPKKIILMMDEGLDEDISRDIAEKLKFNKYYKNQVGYILDKNNLYLPKESKMAPADLPKKDLSKLIKNCTIWI